jgi:hypothetical protein
MALGWISNKAKGPGIFAAKVKRWHVWMVEGAGGAWSVPRHQLFQNFHHLFKSRSGRDVAAIEA